MVQLNTINSRTNDEPYLHGVVGELRHLSFSQKSNSLNERPF